MQAMESPRAISWGYYSLASILRELPTLDAFCVEYVAIKSGVVHDAHEQGSKKEFKRSKEISKRCPQNMYGCLGNSASNGKKRLIGSDS